MSLTERLVVKGTRQDMDYEEKLVYNAPAIAWNAATTFWATSVAKKVVDNVLRMMTALLIVPQPAIPQDPVANPPSTLLKVYNALVIK